MKYEERIPMKHLRNILRNTFAFLAGVVAVILTLSFIGQALALGVYAILLFIIFTVVAYLFFRRPQD